MTAHEEALQIIERMADEALDRVSAYHMAAQHNNQDVEQEATINRYYMEVGAILHDALALAIADVQDKIRQQDRQEDDDRKRAAQRGEL